MKCREILLATKTALQLIGNLLVVSATVKVNFINQVFNLEYDIRFNAPLIVDSDVVLWAYRKELSCVGVQIKISCRGFASQMEGGLVESILLAMQPAHSIFSA